MAADKSHKKSTSGGSIPWIAGALVLLGLAVAGGLYWNRMSKVEKIRFEGNRRVTDKQLKKHTDIPLGIHPDSLNVASVTRKIEQIPYVKTAHLNPQPGGTMVITVDERQPLALLVDGSHPSLIDADGVHLPKVPGRIADVPLLHGFSAAGMQDTLQSKAFKQTGKFLQDLRRRKAADATISEVAWNDKKGIVALTNNDGVKILFGKSDFDDRLRNWQAFCRAVIRHKGMDKMHAIDLRFKGQIVTRENDE